MKIQTLIDASAPGECQATFVREATIVYGPRKRPAAQHVASSCDAIAFIKPLIVDRCVEHFIAVALNGRNKPIAWTTISVGSITTCPVCPSDVYRFAILAGSHALIVAHNHPSGDPSPSPEDIALTDRLASGARLIGVHLLDHIIVAEDGHFSFLDAGLLSRGDR